MNQDSLDFYTQHSPYTDPGLYARLFDDLPDDLPSIVRAIQGLIIPPYPYVLQLHGLRLDDIEDAAFGIRHMESLIAKLLTISDAALSEPRPAHHRLGANCRNFATLLVSLLRHHGVPARLRVGFEGYLGGDLRYEHRIAEVWQSGRGRWALVDAFVDPRLKAARNINIDLLDIVGDAYFIDAGTVWLGARAGDLDASQFGDSPEDIGLPPIRYALLHDFDALNKFEVLGDDAWCELIDKPEADLTLNDLQFLDEVARLTAQPDLNFDKLLHLHRAS